MTRKPKKVTAESLERIALHQLERCPTTSIKLRKTLARRVERSLEYHQGDRYQLLALIGPLVRRLQEAGYLNDEMVAKSRAASMHAKGHPIRAIAYKLRGEGLLQRDIDAAVAELEVDEQDPDMVAAIGWARKKGLGPYRSLDREERRTKDMGSLARRGFSYDICRRVIDANDVEELEASEDW
ncbi:MAG: regulatory protein [Kiritimatiellia bacterium]|jgi:regulatory protein